MYLAVDVGGTKTLLASFDEQAERFTQEVRFPTPDTYEQFLQDFQENLQKLSEKNFSAAGVAIPGVIDREHGIGVSYGNLDWKNNPVKEDVSRIIGGPVFIENDAKAGGLSEAMLINDEFKKVTFITLGTGIGIAFINDGVIDVTRGDRGGNAVLITHEGKEVSWEATISGSAIKRRFGKKATDITDEPTWKIIAHDLALGLSKIIADRQPEAVVVGGGAGKHFERYGDLLKAELTTMLPAPIPAILPAKHPEEAVIYGCVDLIKQNYGQSA